MCSPAYTSVYHVHIFIPLEPEGIVGCPGTGVRDYCELTCMGDGNCTCVLCNSSQYF